MKSTTTEVLNWKSKAEERDQAPNLFLNNAESEPSSTSRAELDKLYQASSKVENVRTAFGKRCSGVFTCADRVSWHAERQQHRHPGQEKEGVHIVPTTSCTVCGEG